MSMSQPKPVRAPRACMRVLRGRVPLELSFAQGSAMRITIGSGEDAGLRFEGAGVAPLHFELVWDGAHLWLQDILRLGRTRVNGGVLNGWWAVAGHAFVSFGCSALMLHADSDVPHHDAPDFAALERARLVEQPQLRRRQTARILVP